MQLGVTIASPDGTILYVNQAMAQMHGYDAEELVGQNLSVFDVSDDAGHVVAGSQHKKRWRREGLNVRKDGTAFPVCMLCDVIEGPESTALVTTCEDLTERRNAEAGWRDRQAMESRVAALHDSLTGLPNRTMLMDMVRRSLSRAKRRKDYLFAVLVLNLDRFHVVNDSLGHTLGDQLLVAIAERLKPCFRTVDILARLSGDEFAILLDDIRDISDALRVANRIEEQLTGAFQIGDEQVFSSACVGIAFNTRDYSQAEELLRDATLALHRVKREAQAKHEVFDEVMHQTANARLQLETDLQWALDRQEFRTHYQPIVSLTTGQITGVEALVRWEHPSRGLLTPPDFLAVAEETGLIVPLGWAVLRQACNQMRQWQEQFPTESPLTMSVNLSGKQLLHRNVVQEIESVLQEAGLDPQYLRLEMTETVIMDDAKSTLRVLSELKELKVHLDIDDFGVGYSSLRYLHRFPIDSLKIDRSFVDSIDVRRESVEIVRIILALAKSIGVSAVAEGVETEKQLTLLKDMKCDYAQGYHLSKPVEHDKAAALIDSGL